MSSQKKKNSFLLLEILISLLLLSISIPLIMRNFSALTRSNQEWRHEEELQKRVDDYFLRVKSSLSFEEIQSLFKKKEEEYLLNHAHLLVRGKKVQTTLFLSQEEKKKEVYLLKLRLVLPRTKKHKTREFSQIYCLKKNAKP